jgi:hypothetical protein
MLLTVTEKGCDGCVSEGLCGHFSFAISAGIIYNRMYETTYQKFTQPVHFNGGTPVQELLK